MRAYCIAAYILGIMYIYVRQRQSKSKSTKRISYNIIYII